MRRAPHFQVVNIGCSIVACYRDHLSFLTTLVCLLTADGTFTLSDSCYIILLNPVHVLAQGELGCKECVGHRKTLEECSGRKVVRR